MKAIYEFVKENRFFEILEEQLAKQLQHDIPENLKGLAIAAARVQIKCLQEKWKGWRTA